MIDKKKTPGAGILSGFPAEKEPPAAFFG